MKPAVEWLEDNLISEPWAEEHFKHNSECWDKANKMFEEQIEKAFDNGYAKCGITHNAQEYYKETFKSEE
jgi:hypothetical protein